jgi:hypothetical protein
MQLKRKFIPNLFLLVTILICLFSGSPDCIAAWSDLNVWLDNGMKKYRQGGEDGVLGNNSLTIKCAKNEFEPLQILLYNNHTTDPITGVDVIINQTSGPGTISDIYIYKQLYINVTTVSRHDYSTGYWPDPLIPKVDRYFRQKRNAFPFDIGPKKVQGIWVDIGTTSTTPPGIYTFNISVTKSGETAKTATVTLHVWNFALPSTPTLKSFMDIGTGNLDDGFFGGTYQGEAWWKNMQKLHMKTLLYHKLGVNTNNNGGWFTTVNTDGTVTEASWKAWDSQYASLLDGTEISSGPYAGIKMPAATVELGNSAGVSNRWSSTSNWINYLQSWWDHFNSKGWDPMNRLYVYAWDEPNGSTMSRYGFTFRGSSTVTDRQVVLTKAQEMNLVKTGGGGMWKNTFTTAPISTSLSSPTEVIGEPGSPYTSLDISGFYFPVTCLYTYRSPWTTEVNRKSRNSYPGYENWTTRNHGGYLANQGSHDRICPASGGVYCTDNAPDIMLETPPVLTRGYFWLQWFYRVHMFLYSDTIHFYRKGKEPYANLMSVFGGNGDEHLFYPGVTNTSGRGLPASTPSIGGSNDIPIESIRLKLLREGIEDREYMELAKQLRSLALVDTQVNTLFGSLTDPGPYYKIKTSGDLLKAREGVANLLLNSSQPFPPKEFIAK